MPKHGQCHDVVFSTRGHRAGYLILDQSEALWLLGTIWLGLSDCNARESVPWKLNNWPFYDYLIKFKFPPWSVARLFFLTNSTNQILNAGLLLPLVSSMPKFLFISRELCCNLFCKLVGQGKMRELYTYAYEIQVSVDVMTLACLINSFC